MMFATHDSGETLGTLFLIVWVPLMIYAYFRFGKFLVGAWGTAKPETREDIKNRSADAAKKVGTALWRILSK